MHHLWSCKTLLFKDFAAASFDLFSFFQIYHQCVIMLSLLLLVYFSTLGLNFGLVLFISESCLWPVLLPRRHSSTASALVGSSLSFPYSPRWDWDSLAATMVVMKMKFPFQKRVKLAQGLWLLSWCATVAGAITFTLGCILKTELRRRAEVFQTLFLTLFFNLQVTNRLQLIV